MNELTKEKAAEMFDVSGKNVRRFKSVSPLGYEFEGWICKSRGSQMGSLIIEKIDNEDAGLQYVQGMPKLSYYNSRQHLIIDPHILEKADGTNVVMFPLILGGECIDVAFKTRMTAELQGKFMNRVKLAIQDAHYQAVEDDRMSYAYELYGAENQHDVINYTARGESIALGLIAVMDKARQVPYDEMVGRATWFGIDRLQEHFKVNSYPSGCMAWPTSYFLDTYGEYCNGEEEELEANSLEELYNNLAAFYEKLNLKFQKTNRGNITEGSVWHFRDGDQNVMIKCKALSVAEGHKLMACGIPVEKIFEELTKAEENIRDIEDVYENGDRRIIVKYIKDGLREHYADDLVDSKPAMDRILSVMAKRLRKAEIPANLKEIAKEIREEVGAEASPADCMRAFAEKYPDLRKQSNKMYQAVVSL